MPGATWNRIATALRRGAEESRRAEREERLVVHFARLGAARPDAVRFAFLDRASALHARAAAHHRIAAALHDEWAAALIGMTLGRSRRSRSSGATLMRAVCAIAGAPSASVSLRTNNSVDVLMASDSRVRELHDLESTLGEGPARDCVASGPLHVAGDDLPRRWRLYGPAAEPLGVRSVTAVPLRAADSALGTLLVLDCASGDCRTVLERLQLVGDALVAIALDGFGGRSEDPRLDDADLRAVVHQAAGIVSERNACPIPASVALLRARAFADDVPLDETARLVVSGALQV
jgi:GAF domain-containing protein